MRRALFLGLVLIASTACGCKSQFQLAPRSVPRLDPRDAPRIPAGRVVVGALAAPDERCHLFKAGSLWTVTEHFASAARWTEIFVEDLAAELNRHAARASVGDPAAVRLRIQRIEFERVPFLSRFSFTLTAIDSSGDVIHEARYVEQGHGYDRAMGACMYRAKQGLLNDPRFLALIR